MLGIEREQFYDESQVAIVLMGFCYPGAGTSGDLPPRPEWAATWHARLLPHLRERRLTVLVGRYAQAWFLREHQCGTLTDTVRAHADFLVMPGLVNRRAAHRPRARGFPARVHANVASQPGQSTVAQDQPMV